MIEVAEENVGSPPVTWNVIKGKSADVASVASWLRERRKDIETALTSTGAILLRGFSELRSAADFETISHALAPKLMDYVGGTSPRRVIHGRIMSATEVPEDYSIPLHQEMAYTDVHPDRIFFFCCEAASEGGATTIADMRTVTEALDEDLVQRWVDGGVQLRRTLPSEEGLHMKPGVPKTWCEVFDTRDRDVVEDIVRGRGWRTKWLDNGAVQLWQELRPATKTHPATGDTVWFNQAHIFAPVSTMYWAHGDGRLDQWERLVEANSKYPEMMDQVFHLNENPIKNDDVMHVYHVLAQHERSHLWQNGDILLLDNTLIAHGRTRYSGRRQILTALVDDSVA